LALVLIGGAGLAQQRADTPLNPYTNDPSAGAAGKALFEGTCAACHGADAGGGRGPALNTGRFAHGSEPFDLFQTVSGGVPGTQMPSFAALPSNDIWKIVTYLRGLSGEPSAQTRKEASTGDPGRGEALFFGKGACSSCHEINGRGADVGPDLSAVGARAAPLRPGVLHNRPKPAHGAPAPMARFAEVTLADGRTLSGILKAEDSFTLDLRLPDGELRSLDRADVRQLRTRPGDGAPQDVAARLSPGEIDDLVAYLRRQTHRDLAAASRAVLPPGLSPDRLNTASREPRNWLTYWGDYSGAHFSDLSQITPANVGGLQARWAASLPGGSVLEATPVVVDGVMYVSGPPGDVYALDARTGLRLWSFHRKQEVVNPYQINPYNRGVAVLGGRVFVGTLDDRVIALDARSGRELWETQVADPLAGYTLTGAPLALKDRIIVGMAGGELGARGFLDAYDAKTGARLWRRYTIPGPGEVGHDTWAGESWEHGSGATWLTGSYDPGLNLLYWTVGNPGPDNNAAVRQGDNLYSCSVLALDPETGALKWHYQFTPNDSHDWDSVEDVVLADRMVNGRMRKLLLHADRNGFFYVLDRTNGAFLWAKPFVRQNWNAGFDANGRPQVRPESVAAPDGKVVFPAVGATNFQAPSYDAQTGAFYLAFLDSQGFVSSAPAVWEKGRLYLGRGVAPAPAAPPPPEQGIKALDSATGRVLWTYPLMRPSLSAGVLGVRGGLVFAATPEGELIALDAKAGGLLWRFQTGATITASPMSYAVDGRQYVAVTAGNMLFSFALPPDPKGRS
jgi:alcohol dehydrogenase (cytochrome c)